MSKYVHLILAIAVVFGPVNCFRLNGETSVVDRYKKQEKKLSQKRFKQKKWSGEQQSDLIQKIFPFKHWNKHYSSIGSKKWNTAVQKSAEKKQFELEKKEILISNMEFVEWQAYLINLESRGRISVESTAQIIQDKRVYETLLQRAEHYSDLGELLSLREINRFQFRKNRLEDFIPSVNVGSGDNF